MCTICTTQNTASSTQTILFLNQETWHSLTLGIKFITAQCKQHSADSEK